MLFIDYLRSEITGGQLVLARLVNYFQKHPSLKVKPFVYLNNFKGFADKFIDNEVLFKEYNLPKQILKLNRKSSLIEMFFKGILLIPFFFCFSIKLFRFCQKEQIDIIHANSMTGLIVSTLSAKLAKTKLVFHLHEALLSSGEGGAVESATQKIIVFFMKYFVNAVITVSDFVKDTVLTKDRSIEPKLYTLHNGVEVKQFNPGSSQGLREDKNKPIQLLSFGRLIKIKGFQLGIEAVSILRHRHNMKIEYSLLGAGSYEPDLVALSKKLKVEKEIQFLGFQDDVKRWIREADIVLVPSVWQEPFSLPVIESMAERKPVIAAKVGGIPEIIENGKSGFLVSPERAPEEMAKKIIELVNNPAFKQRIAENGLKRVEQNFSIERMTNSLSQIYFSL